MISQSAYKADIDTSNVLQLKQSFGLVFSTIGNHAVVSYHPVTEGVIGIGRVVDINSAVAAVESFASDLLSKPEASPWTSHDVIYSDTNYFIFKTPKNTKQSLWFRFNGSASERVDALLPTIVYVFDRQNQRLNMFASITDSVHADTPLYMAPFCNVNGNGWFCTGSAPLPPVSATESEIKAGVLECVFNSLFTHLSGGNKTFKGVKSNADHLNVWKELAAKGKAPTSTKLLNANITLRQFVVKKGN
jgi:PRTRC genetic system protein B